MSADPVVREFATKDWSVYRTRFLVRAKQLRHPLSFKDALGREHHGSAGDYLVQSSEGIFRIAPREIFEDIYVVLEDIENRSGNWTAPLARQRLSA